MTRRIRVLHVLTTGHSSARGIAQIVMNLASRVDKAGYRTSVLFLKDDGPLGAEMRDRAITTSVARWHRGAKDPLGALRFGAHIANGRFDIVHLHAGGLAPRLAIRAVSRAKIVAHYHSLVEENGFAGRKRSARYADLVIANSEATARTIAGASPVVIHPGVRVRPQSRGARDREGPVKIGVASRLVPVKGMSDLVAATGILVRGNLDVQLEIAGAGVDEPSLRTQVNELGISSRVRFAGWVSDMESMMRTWDLYAHPSHAEGFGTSVLEAMAVGLPVVATAVGGVPEIVLDGETGFLVPKSRPDQIADRLVRLVRAPELRIRMGDRGRARAIAQFSQELEATAIRSAYEQLLA